MALGVVEDVERVFDLVESDGTGEQRAWLDRWGEQFNEAVETADEELCEDMHLALVVFERTAFRPPRRTYTLAEVATEPWRCSSGTSRRCEQADSLRITVVVGFVADFSDLDERAPHLLAAQQLAEEPGVVD
jgi:hypothetical protein